MINTNLSVVTTSNTPYAHEQREREEEKTANNPSFQALNIIIQKLQYGKYGMQCKAAFYKNAVNLFQQHNLEFKITSFRLSAEESSQFILTPDRFPAYFSENYVPQDSNFSITPEFYTYEVPDDGHEHIFVDFAYKILGGGWKKSSLAQEEVIALEIPDFTAHVANSPPIFTRLGGQGLLEGYPTPYLMKGLHRVQKVLSYRRITPSNPLSVEPLKEPQMVTMLALSAANLHDPAYGVTIEATCDLFNTIMAGMTLARKSAIVSKKYTLHSGKIGCGAFKNNIVIGYLTQRLAAELKGVPLLKLYGYSREESAIGLQLWNALKPQFKDKNNTECLVHIREAVKMHFNAHV